MSYYTPGQTTQYYTNPVTGGTGVTTTSVNPGYGYSTGQNVPYSGTGYSNTGYTNGSYGYQTTGVGHTSKHPHTHGVVSGNNYSVVTPGLTNPITGQTHALGTNTYGTTGTGVYNTGYSKGTGVIGTVPTQGYGYTNTNTYGSGSGYHNPYGLSVPTIAFSPQCRKCHGTGVSRSMFSGTPVPCTRCYTRAGYCKKCYGTGTNYRKGKACNRCQAGKRLKNASSSSSD